MEDQVIDESYEKCLRMKGVVLIRWFEKNPKSQFKDDMLMAIEVLKTLKC